MSNTTVLIVPGLRDHVADHWQTLLAAELPRSRTVPPLERDKLNLALRIAAIEGELAQIPGPVVFVAHSGGVPTIIWQRWSARPSWREIGAASSSRSAMSCISIRRRATGLGRARSNSLLSWIAEMSGAVPLADTTRSASPSARAGEWTVSPRYAWLVLVLTFSLLLSDYMSRQV